MAGNSKKPIAFCTRCVSFFFLAGQKISALKAQSTVTSTLSRRLHIVPTEVFLTIIRHHVREGHLQYLAQLRADVYAEDHEETDDTFDMAKSAASDSIPCELGLRYPLLQSIMAGKRNHQTIQVWDVVSDIVYDIVYDIVPD